MYHVIQSHSTIKSRYGSLWDWKYFHVVGNHVIENHVKQGMTVQMSLLSEEEIPVMWVWGGPKAKLTITSFRI